MFLPKRIKTFDRIVELSSTARKAADVLGQIASSWNIRDNWIELKRLEAEADDLVHAITDEVEKAFILSLDKEDIRRLVELLDDIVDDIEKVAHRLYIYKIPGTNQTLKGFSTLISQAVQQVYQGALKIQERKLASHNFASCCKALHDIEAEGDRLYRMSLEDIMSGKEDVLSVVKWREILGTLEDILDICEDVAVVFELIRIKYA